MKIALHRQPSTESSTPGKLFVDGEFECHTLEDVERPRGVKVPGKTAIPRGHYRVVITHSPRFGVPLPLLFNVERDGVQMVEGWGTSFVGVRIHPGNTAADTEGCILVGSSAEPDRVSGSRGAFAALFDMIQRAHATGDPITLDITGSWDIGQ